MDLTVNVTQEDIDNGIKTSCSRCPQARALLRAVNQQHPGMYRAIVDRMSMVVAEQENTTGTYFVTSTPLAVRKFIENYDNGRRVVPMSYKLHMVKRD